MKIKLQLYLMMIIGSLFLSNTLTAIEYKEYKYSRHQKEYFEIIYDKTEIRIKTFEDDEHHLLIYPKKSIKISNGKVYSNETILFDEEGLLIDDRQYFYDKISDIRITDNDNFITITFLTKKTDLSKSSRFKKGNFISVKDLIVIEEDEFIRGFVLSIIGNVEIYGEVNKDVVALFGDVYIAPDAVARGDVASVSGRIDVARDASIYGEVYYIDRKGINRKHRFMREKKNFSISGTFRYNRVDGLTIFLGAEFKDADSLLPTIWTKGGYAFESKHWRYDFGLEQILLRYPVISIGGSLYRRLASDDDWLLSNRENGIFVLLATEDFKDYYEAEGGTAYLNIKPFSNLIFESRYRYEETKWLDAKRHLWSLFGGNKLFRENFSSVNDNFRNKGIKEIDTTANAIWYNRIDWDTRLKDNPFNQSAWHITADLEWSHPDFNSDYNYNRYTIAVRRYQKVNRRAMLLIRGMYGGSDGYLPMYKRFYLGGLGTLRGYRHKELMGTRFWMANTEYRVDFPKTETAISVFWDVAQIANEKKLDSNIDIKNNIGVALYLGDDFKISLAKRLDRSYNDNPKIYVRLEHVL